MSRYKHAGMACCDEGVCVPLGSWVALAALAYLPALSFTFSSTFQT